MKHILLLGDSIRQNYQEYVKEKCKDFADVRFPIDNGRFSYYTLRYVHEWINALSRDDNICFDVIHFNTGLWDVLRLSSDDETFIDEEQYARTLIRIYRRIRMRCPNAKIIFALTTKIIEPGFAPGTEIGYRRNGDIKKFNDIAINVFRDTDVVINDLWSVSECINDTAHSDDVHFDTPEGIRELGNQVVYKLKEVIEVL